MTATDTKPVPVPDSDLAETIVYRMLADFLLDKYIWVRGLSWYRWSGSRWESVSDEHVRDFCARWVRGKYTRSLDTAGAENTATATGYAAEWAKYQKKGRIDSLRTLAKGVLEVQADALDGHPELLNCANGTVDLSTGELRPHDPRDYLTKTTGHAYTPGAVHDDWDKALEAVPVDVLGWLKVKFGQGVTGRTPDDDRIVFLNGGGANGKSTVIAAISSAIGDYFHVVAPRALLGDARTHTTELADFRGARFAVLEELPDKGMSISRVKNLAGTPKITARHIAKDSVVFDASHTMFVTTNHHPAVAETDHGTWRRLALVKFPYTFRDNPDPEIPTQRHGEPGLRQRITAADESFSEAVLAWLVAGAREWFDSGQVTPELPQRVADDTLAWRMESDTVLRFWNDRLMPVPGVFTPSSDLFRAYVDWAEQRNLQPMPDRTLFPKLAAHEVAEQYGVTQMQARTAKLTVSRHPDLKTRPMPKIARGWQGVALKDVALKDEGPVWLAESA
jgi:putative DNA primase/helicase